MRGERVALALTPEGGFIKTLSGKVKGLKESEEDAVEKKNIFGEIPLGALGLISNGQQRWLF